MALVVAVEDRGQGPLHVGRGLGTRHEGSVVALNPQEPGDDVGVVRGLEVAELRSSGLGGCRVQAPDRQRSLHVAQRDRQQRHAVGLGKALDDAKKAQRDAKKKAVDTDPKVKQLRDEIDKQTKLKNDPRADDAIKDKYQEKINKAQEDLNKAKGDAEKNWNDSQEKKDTQKAIDDAQKEVNDLEKNKPPLPPDADKMTQPDGQGKVDEKDMGKEGGSSVMPSGVGR